MGGNDTTGRVAATIESDNDQIVFDDSGPADVQRIAVETAAAIFLGRDVRRVRFMAARPRWW